MSCTRIRDSTNGIGIEKTNATRIAQELVSGVSSIEGNAWLMEQYRTVQGRNDCVVAAGPRCFSPSSSSSSSPSSFSLFLLLLFLLIHTCTDTCESAVWIPPRRHPLDSIRTALIQIFWKFIDFESRGRSGRMATSSRDQKIVDFELKSFKKSLISRAMACQGERPRAASTRFLIKIL